MAAAAILKIPKIAISRQRFGRSAQNLARLRILACRTGPALEISNFEKLRMADGRHLDKSKNTVLVDINNSLLKTGNTSSSAVPDKPARHAASRQTAKF